MGFGRDLRLFGRLRKAIHITLDVARHLVDFQIDGVADLLATLPPRERRAGYAEIVKAALIGDRPLFDRLEAAGASTAPIRDTAQAPGSGPTGL